MWPQGRIAGCAFSFFSLSRPLFSCFSEAQPEQSEQEEEEEDEQLEEAMSRVTDWQIWQIRSFGSSIKKVTLGVGKNASPSGTTIRKSALPPASPFPVPCRADRRRKSRVTGPRCEGSAAALLLRVERIDIDDSRDDVEARDDVERDESESSDEKSAGLRRRRGGNQRISDEAVSTGLRRRSGDAPCSPDDEEWERVRTRGCCDLDGFVEDPALLSRVSRGADRGSWCCSRWCRVVPRAGRWARTVCERYSSIAADILGRLGIITISSPELD